MGAIDIGSAAEDRSNVSGATLTYVDKTNPANDTGKITQFELWFATDGSGVKVGTFSGATLTFTSRDVETLGNVTAGSKQTFSGLNCDVSSGDFIGIYFDGGAIERSASGGSGAGYKSGDQFGEGQQVYTNAGSLIYSMYGTGASPEAPTVTTSAATSITSSGCTGNGEITVTFPNCTRRGFCYKAGTSGDPTIADSVVYDDGDYGTGSFNKAISGLSSGTSYRVRAYAVNVGGTGYGSTVSVTTAFVCQVGGGAVAITGVAMDTARGFSSAVGGAVIGIVGGVASEISFFLANVGGGAIAIAGSLGSHIIRRLYATVGGAYRTFLEVTKPYRGFKKSGDYRRFKE